MTIDPYVARAITYDTYRQRAVEPDGTVHAAKYARDRQHVTLACTVYPLPDIDRVAGDRDVWTVTCGGCRAALAVVVTCPLCRTPGAEEISYPIPNTDDVADGARCVNPECGLDWGLDPGADGACIECGGSGHIDHGTRYDPVCACTEDAEAPLTVVLCGVPFTDAMAEATRQETAHGNIVLAPGCDLRTPHPLWNDPADAEALRPRLAALHRAKIRAADEVLVVGDHLDADTHADIEYARHLGKHIRYTHPEAESAQALAH
ncbi:hypothetical protein [Streptomyces niveiscabiei]|uniref:hypothetical protein n=1 Tax=Streptomyces niveiscabiei TaxID=164115 RepID=UPI0038F76ECD